MSTSLLIAAISLCNFLFGCARVANISMGVILGQLICPTCSCLKGWNLTFSELSEPYMCACSSGTGMLPWRRRPRLHSLSCWDLLGGSQHNPARLHQLPCWDNHPLRWFYSGHQLLKPSDFGTNQLTIGR